MAEQAIKSQAELNMFRIIFRQPRDLLKVPMNIKIHSYNEKTAVSAKQALGRMQNEKGSSHDRVERCLEHLKQLAGKIMWKGESKLDFKLKLLEVNEHQAEQQTST